MKTVLACDLGASNGRMVAGVFDGSTIELLEIHRFPNQYVEKDGHYYWDFPSLVSEIEIGLKKADTILGTGPKSIGFDTWGVDFGLVDGEGRLVGNPLSYRDSLFEEAVPDVLEMMGKYELFKQTGNEVNSINTLFQLYAIRKNFPHSLQEAHSILMMPTLLSHHFSGVKVNEFTISSTSQLLDRNTNDWHAGIMETVFGEPLPLAPIQLPHRILGAMKKGFSESKIDVVLVPGHDTACALSALPMNDEEAAFISLGTWGIMGRITESAILSKEVFSNGFTNEGTSEGKNRLQKNAMGFWILQNLRKEWDDFSYNEEKEWLNTSSQSEMLINPENPLFFNPDNMTEAINEYCQRTNQRQPRSVAEYVRCIVESMALNFSTLVDKIERVSSSKVKNIYMGGGGIQNGHLCQFIASASNRQVITGPVEASALGNVVSQLRAQGDIASLEDGKEIIRRSIEETVYEPQAVAEWAKAKERFEQLIHMEGEKNNA